MASLSLSGDGDRFKHMVSELTRQISTEEERTRVKDHAHVAYSTLAKAISLRRTKLLDSVAALRAKLDIAKRELGEAEAKLCALEPAPNRQLRKIDPASRTLAQTSRLNFV
jgi:flagellar protein FliJ